jgi:hypothetical protein
MPKGNIAINKNMAKIIKNGRIAQEIPMILSGGRMEHLFTSYGIIERPVSYWICSNPGCGKHHTDMILGVTGSANYSDEFKDKQIGLEKIYRSTNWEGIHRY